MKTVKSGSGENVEIKRVDDNEAETLVANKGWKYCPKSEFRKAHPNANRKQEVAKPKVEKVPKRSKKDKEMDMAIPRKSK